jgi:hypothetical protein
MRRLALFACLAAFLTAPSGPAQVSWYHEGHGSMPQTADRLVRSWYDRYLHRSARDGEEIGWVKALVAGQSPDHVLSGILGSVEFYNNAGGTPEWFIEALFRDLNRRPPERREMEFWVGRMHVASTNDVAYEMLTRFPQHWGEGPYFPDDHRYDVRRPELRPYQK